MNHRSELNQDDPHPMSGHRTPREIAEDEAGAIGGTSSHPLKNLRAENGPARSPDKSPEWPGFLLRTATVLSPLPAPHSGER